MGVEPRKRASCIFEYVYFARPDSVMDGQSVYLARREMGKILAREAPAEADLVVGVPDSGLPSAMGYSLESGIPYSNAIVKNRYVGRTFIEPTDEMRQMGIRIKLNPLSSIIKDQRLVIIDDSIVRGTQLGETTQFLYDSGAKEVHVRPACPPIMFGCKYLNFSRSSSEMDLITRRVIADLEEGNEISEELLKEYADPKF
mgnify:CR=1 FL=1